LVYGSYEAHDEAQAALDEIGALLARGGVLRIGAHNERETVFLVPATSVYYVVLAPTS
jgi:hypothetical protein